MNRVLVLATVAACSGPNGAFQCTTNGSCRNGGTIGTCESTGYCSFPDPTCPSGSRYGAAAGGGLANQCVGGGGSGSDAGVVTADAGMPEPLGAWTTTQALVPSRYSHAMAQSANYVYAIGGIAGTTSYPDVDYASANPGALFGGAVLGTWDVTISLPTNRRTFGAAYYDGYLYVFGGRTDPSMPFDGDVLSAQVSDLGGGVGAWTTTTALPEGIRCHAMAQSGADVYLVGGKTNTGASSAVLHTKLNGGATAAWDLAAMLDTTVFDGAAVAIDGYLYVIGGCAAGDHVCSQVLDVVESAPIHADGSLGPFTHTTSLPMARSHHTAVAYADKNTIYVLGGTYGTSTGDPATTDVIGAGIGANGTVGAWQPMTALPGGRRRATSAIIGKWLVFVQGDSQVAPIQ